MGAFLAALFNWISFLVNIDNVAAIIDRVQTAKYGHKDCPSFLCHNLEVNPDSAPYQFDIILTCVYLLQRKTM